MNKYKLQELRNKVASSVRSFHTKRNVIYLNTHNSRLHELIKFNICYELQKLGTHYITEAKLGFGKQGIADILVLDTEQVIEILVSETELQVSHKVKKYPKSLEIIGVTSWEDYFNGNYKVIREKEV